MEESGRVVCNFAFKNQVAQREVEQFMFAYDDFLPSFALPDDAAVVDEVVVDPFPGALAADDRCV